MLLIQGAKYPDNEDKIIKLNTPKPLKEDFKKSQDLRCKSKDTAIQANE